MRELIAAIAAILEQAAGNQNVTDEQLRALMAALCAIANQPAPATARRGG